MEAQKKCTWRPDAVRVWMVRSASDRHCLLTVLVSCSSPATAASLSIVDRFLNDMVPPILEEGFSRVHVLQRSDDPAVQQQHVEELLVAVQSPPPPVQP